MSFEKSKSIPFVTPSKALIEVAHAYAENGWRVFPRYAKRDPKSGKVKQHPLTKHDFKDATTDPRRIDAWWGRNPNAMICAATGEMNDLLVIEIDVKNAKQGLAEWSELKAGRDLPSTRTSTSPSGGKHLYFKHRDGIRIGHLTPGVEFKGDGGSITLPPSRRPDGQYVWDNDLPIADPPEWLVELCWAKSGKSKPMQSKTRGAPTFETKPSKELMARMSINPGRGLSDDPEDTHPIETMLQVIRPDLPREDWIKVGCILFKLYGDEKGFEIWDQWSAGCEDKYDQTEMAEQWASFVRADGYGWDSGTLYYLAHKADPNWRNTISDDGLVKTDVGDGQVRTDVKPRTYKGVPPLPTFRHGHVSAKPARWLVRNRVPETGAGLLLGQWGAFKSFVILDLSVHVMLGWNWTGQPIYRPGGVLAFAPEGANGLPLRLAALIEHKIEPRKDDVSIDLKHLPFEWVAGCPPLKQPTALAKMVSTAEDVRDRFQQEYKLPLSLIWIDTMMAAAAWQNENDNVEAARALALLRDLSAETGAAVIGVDHLGKNIESGARGASAKEDNSDFVLAIFGIKEITGNVSDTQLVLRKLKEGPQGETFPFNAPVVDMGKDDHGYPVTSRVINWNVVREPKPEKPEHETLRLFYQALNEVTATKGSSIMTAGQGEVRAARRDDVREAFRALYKPSDPNMKNSARDQRFRTALGQATRVQGATVDGIEYLYQVEEAL